MPTACYVCIDKAVYEYEKHSNFVLKTYVACITSECTRYLAALEGPLFEEYVYDLFC